MEEINNLDRSRAAEGKSSIIFVLIGWISALLSVLAYPFIFGVIGVIMGILASKNQSRAGLPIIVTSILLMGIGLIFSNPIAKYTMKLLGLF